MALMSPATTEADVDRHTEVFDEAARELTGPSPGRCRARTRRARSRSNGPVGSPSSAKHVVADRVLLVGGCLRRYVPAGPTANVNGSQKSSKSS